MRSSPDANPVVGEGVDRSLIRMMLAMTPTQRIASLTQEARFVKEIRRAGQLARRQTVARAQRSLET